MHAMFQSCTRPVVLALALLAPLSCLAADEPAAAGDAGQGVAFKFTSGLYQLRGGGLPNAGALDLNLRVSGSFGNAWVGQFRSPSQSITQTRLGWDRQFDFGAVRLTPSLEVATGGYVGGSAYLEAGRTWVAGVGLSRTNLQNFVNLNFDPGDAYTLAGGYRWADSRSLILSLIRDNRLNPDQQNVHLVYRTPISGGQRLTLDGLYKTGLVAGVGVREVGFSATYDWPKFFVRAAWDPKVNFTPQDMFRLSVGTRF
ncbi:MAG: hypothetical protein V4451_08395 [Pseudomonadota bacterium]